MRRLALLLVATGLACLGILRGPTGAPALWSQDFENGAGATCATADATSCGPDACSTPGASGVNPWCSDNVRNIGNGGSFSATDEDVLPNQTATTAQFDGVLSCAAGHCGVALRFEVYERNTANPRRDLFGIYDGETLITALDYRASTGQVRLSCGGPVFTVLSSSNLGDRFEACLTYNHGTNECRLTIGTASGSPADCETTGGASLTETYVGTPGTIGNFRACTTDLCGDINVAWDDLTELAGL